MPDFQRFFILKNVGKIKKTLKTLKKRFFTSMIKTGITIILIEPDLAPPPLGEGQ